jgi:hypothetical protein
MFASRLTKRPHLLKKLLLSLVAQETGGEFSWTIIAADNDAQRSAEPVVCEFTVSRTYSPELNWVSSRFVLES